MKRAVLTMLVVAGVVAMAYDAVAQQEVTSVNVVGFRKIDLAPSNGFTQVGMQFDAFDPTLQGVLSTQLIASTKVGGADQVYIWDTASSTYKRYAMKPDNLFYDANDFGGAPTNPPLHSGEGFWIRSAPTAPTSRQIVIAGEAVPDPAITNAIVTGFQMKAFPFSCEVNLQDLDFANDGATSSSKSGGADQIYVWENGAYSIYALKTSTMQWHDISDFGGPAPSKVIPLGQGFWYVAKAPFAWSETNRYSIK